MTQKTTDLKMIPMLDLKQEYEHMKEDIDAAIKGCLDHQRWILGPEVKELEDSIADYLQVKHCIGISSGTDALVLSLRALAFQAMGKEFFDATDEIITTPFTFTATGDAILRAGGTPVFVDIDPTTGNIDPEAIKQYLAVNSTNVVGILPVHLYGLSCQMDEINSIAAEHNLFVLEDVAQGFGGSWQGKKLGAIGSAGIFSFFPSKNLGGFGDGGMVATSDDGVAEMVRMLLRHGGKDKYNVEYVGYNARLDTLQAAIILAKFKYIDEFNSRRQKIAAQYSEKLSDVEQLITPTHRDGHVYHQYTIKITNSKRTELQEHLKNCGISSMIYYAIPLHHMKVFSTRMKIHGDLINTTEAANQVLSLPIEPLQSDRNTALVIERVKEFFSV